MSAAVLRRVIDHAPIRDSTYLVLLILAHESDTCGASGPTIATIAGRSRLSERQTQRVLRKLESKGQLFVVRCRRDFGRGNGIGQGYAYYVTSGLNRDQMLDTLRTHPLLKHVKHSPERDVAKIVERQL